MKIEKLRALATGTAMVSSPDYPWAVELGTFLLSTPLPVHQAPLRHVYGGQRGALRWLPRGMEKGGTAWHMARWYAEEGGELELFPNPTGYDYNEAGLV